MDPRPQSSRRRCAAEPPRGGRVSSAAGRGPQASMARRFPAEAEPVAAVESASHAIRSSPVQAKRLVSLVGSRDRRWFNARVASSLRLVRLHHGRGAGRALSPMRRAWDRMSEDELAVASPGQGAVGQIYISEPRFPLVAERADRMNAGSMPRLNAVMEIGSVMVVRGSSRSNRSVFSCTAGLPRRRSVKLRRKRLAPGVILVRWRSLAWHGDPHARCRQIHNNGARRLREVFWCDRSARSSSGDRLW